MFIAIIGTPSAGKQTVLDYLVNQHGFLQVGLQAPNDQMEDAKISSNQLDGLIGLSLPSTSAFNPHTTGAAIPSPPLFANSSHLLDYITRNWLQHHVTTDLRTFDDIEPFVKRPFFLLISVDGPLRTRFERERKRLSAELMSLDSFIDRHDLLLNGVADTSLPNSSLARHPQTDFRRVVNLASLRIYNNFSTISSFHAYLHETNLLNEERLRPGWDTYFMTLASLASLRSNCMKRRVGALLVRSKRILSTGYNGTPRGTRNCNQGGCRRCNGSARGGEALDECLCLHAEENALLEAGRERIGDDALLYCNTYI
ncbi:MAG: Deoxycytidine monophosphate (dCMP) deaminase [Tremellales sp. Tagirdzhanova-0007]|nr:MAG: Deoxycytidine monophosphate (dCMP) deaminase [Tremellales sp. Tagirdzhanova-0007]